MFIKKYILLYVKYYVKSEIMNFGVKYIALYISCFSLICMILLSYVMYDALPSISYPKGERVEASKGCLRQTESQNGAEKGFSGTKRTLANRMRRFVLGPILGTYIASVLELSEASGQVAAGLFIKFTLRPVTRMVQVVGQSCLQLDLRSWCLSL